MILNVYGQYSHYYFKTLKWMEVRAWSLEWRGLCLLYSRVRHLRHSLWEWHHCSAAAAHPLLPTSHNKCFSMRPVCIKVSIPLSLGSLPPELFCYVYLFFSALRIIFLLIWENKIIFQILSQETSNNHKAEKSIEISATYKYCKNKHKWYDFNYNLVGLGSTNLID